MKQLEFLGERLGLDAGRFRPGIRVPWQGGEELATLGSDGKLVLIHADLNAAQNLQRRFWTRHADAYRVSAVDARQAGQTVWYPDREGPRLRGALSTLVEGDGYARLVPAANGEQFVLENVTKRQWKRAVGAEADPDDEEGLDAVGIALAEIGQNEELQRGEGRKVFFRDPSGHVLPSDRWYEARTFWGRVERRIAKALGIIPVGGASWPLTIPRDGE